ncbi:MAG: hypothetical protein GY822_23495 [Deltaproteobacteria bacterium]|nr:hypothetical protein [Deltaproteobacteria bacterium]
MKDSRVTADDFTSSMPFFFAMMLALVVSSALFSVKDEDSMFVDTSHYEVDTSRDEVELVEKGPSRNLQKILVDILVPLMTYKFSENTA